ncbi:unnamed protein product [Acanthoscelides obtectus]|uniref:CCHC-type domain-containing protein n=1 Tax=Acanthoscelides obtectus TaxID=200917 RepID=A0A9P0M6X8_ACAOB|nr:unnamed protein product [Acanthoscelides obtectus]CAK1624208.1 hypothetical protein AOBTE_LOCUS2403 [Acanthoscelides obtectus]
MDKIPAKHLIQKGRIVTTWSIWPVKERVSILRCFNCLEFGHRAERCTGADRRGECRNCGQAGHTPTQRLQEHLVLHYLQDSWTSSRPN